MHLLSYLKLFCKSDTLVVIYKIQRHTLHTWSLGSINFYEENRNITCNPLHSTICRPPYPNSQGLLSIRIDTIYPDYIDFSLN